MRPECDSIRTWLGAYADKELDPARTDQVRRHLETCADCRRELAQIQELHRLVKSVEHPRLAEDYWHWHRTRVWHGIREQRRELMPRFKPSFMWTKLATVTAGVAIVLVVVIAGWRMLGERSLLTGKGAVAERTQARPQASAPSEALKTPAAVATEEKVATAEARHEEAEVSASGGAAAGARAAGNADKAASGFAGKAGGLARTESEPPAARANAADESERLSAPPPAIGKSAGLMATLSDSIATGPVLLESPPMPDFDILDTGTVLLNVTTDSSGLVLRAVVSQTSGSALLDSIALLQVRKSRFKALVKNNRQVPGSFEYPYRFQKPKPKPKQD
jgi:TonB family protein